MMRQKQSLEVGVGVSSNPDGREAGAEAARQARERITAYTGSVVIVYASSHYDLVAMLRAIADVVGTTVVIGTTTSGEICNGPYHRSVVVVILASPHLSVRYGVGRNVSRNMEQAVQEAVTSPAIQRYFQLSGKHWQALTGQGASAFGLLFSPGNTKYADSRSYEILELLKLKSFGQLPIVGGSSADNGVLEKNYVLADGKVFDDSILLAIFETKLQFGLALSHGFSITPRQAMITAVDGREVLTLDGKPAADVLTALMKSSREELAGKHITFVTGSAIGMSDPMGQYSVVISTYLTERGGVRFTQPLPVGATLTVLESHRRSMVRAGVDVLRKTILRGTIERPAIALVNYCAIRPRLMGEAYSTREIAMMTEMMGNAPLVGFFSYGEQGVADDGISRQNNVAISALMLGLDLSQAAKVAIENDRLHGEVTRNASLLAERNTLLQSEIAERVRTEQALRKSEEALLLSHAQLEAKVLERTADLRQANETLQTEKTLQAALIKQLGEAQSQLLQSEKMASIGVLAAGVAHEINNPIGFVNSNLGSLQLYAQDILRLLDGYQRCESALPAEAQQEINRLKRDIDVAFLREDLSSLLSESLEGLRRVKRIVQDMRDFSHVGASERQYANLEDGLDSTLNLVWSELKYKAEVVKEYGNIPPIECVPSQLNQVFMNLLVNAAHAIEERGRIVVRTGHDNENVWVEVEDTGKGILPEHLGRIFEPFFTTKPVGKGTGLGLALSYGIVQKHDGRIEVRSEVGKGSVFRVVLPIRPTDKART